MRQSEPAKKNVNFINWSSTPFTWAWGGQAMTFQPGQSVMMEQGMAIHFATHLADREINNMPGGWEKYNTRKLPKYQELMRQAISEVSADEVSFTINDGEADLAEIQRLNANRKTEAQMLAEARKENGIKAGFCDSCDSKGVRHKKDCPTLVKAEVEFPDLHAAAA